MSLKMGLQICVYNVLVYDQVVGGFIAIQQHEE